MRVNLFRQEHTRFTYNGLDISRGQLAGTIRRPFTVSPAVGQANQHETAPADISGGRVHDREGKSRGYGGIDRIPSRPKNLNSGIRGPLCTLRSCGPHTSRPSG